jgi:hypothetical protein
MFSDMTSQSRSKICLQDHRSPETIRLCCKHFRDLLAGDRPPHRTTKPRKIHKHANTRGKHPLTLSIPSYSLPRLVPRVGAVGAVLSSLPLADPVLRSRFLVEVTVAVMGFAAALRCAFISCLKFLESSRFSSLYLRKRS